MGAGFSIGVLTKPQITGVVMFQLMVLFFFPMALMSFLSWSVGESVCRERRGARLAAFDALFKGDWLNATFARASLVGVAAGLGIAALFTLLPYLLQVGECGSTRASSPGRGGTTRRGLASRMVGFGVAYALYVGAFGHLLLVSLGSRLAGRRLGPALAVVACAVLFFPVTTVFPFAWNLPLWLLSPAIFVALFLRYGIFSSAYAYLVAFVASSAMPFLQAADSSIQLQAAIALFLVGLPLIVSVRYLAEHAHLLLPLRGHPAARAPHRRA